MEEKVKNAGWSVDDSSDDVENLLRCVATGLFSQVA